MDRLDIGQNGTKEDKEEAWADEMTPQVMDLLNR